MAEGEVNESPPLSQESYLQLFKELANMNTSIHNDLSNFPMLTAPDLSAMEMLRNLEVQFKEPEPLQNQSTLPIDHQPEQKRPISSLPATEDWPGKYSFSINFDVQKSTKGISWIFSPEANKLYVGKNVSCPVKFSTSVPMATDVYIRAMALFSSSDHAAEKVTRCINHSMDELTNNIFEAEHLVRCDSTNAVYMNDSSGRHCVIVPFENPSAGQIYSTYLYKFMCFGSCSGGPNRRPLMLVFTLENQRGEVFGRRTLDLKICACPARDYKEDIKKASDVKENKPVKRSSAGLDSILTSLPKKPKIKDEKQLEKVYTIKTTDEKCYAFLKKIKRLYDLHNEITTRFPAMKSLLSSQSSSGEEN